MAILKVKDFGDSYQVNDLIYVPKASDNPQHKEIQKWIAGGGVVDPEFSIFELKGNLIQKIKAETYRRIIDVYPEYKQRNLNGAVSEIQNKEIIALKAGAGNYTPTESEMTLLRAAKACKEFVDGLRTKSNQLETSLDSMTEEQLSAFNPNEDSHWE